MPMAMAGSPKTTDAPAPADGGDERHADDRHDDGADVAAGDVGADGEAAPLRRELLGQQAVADRVLRRAADARRDVRDREGQEVGGQRLGRHPATEQDPAEAQQPAARDDPRQVGVAELDGPGRERPEGDQERDVIDPDRELVDDLDEDQRQQDRLRVVDGVGDRQQAQRAHRADVVRRGRHLARRSRRRRRG